MLSHVLLRGKLRTGRQDSPRARPGPSSMNFSSQPMTIPISSPIRIPPKTRYSSLKKPPPSVGVCEPRMIPMPHLQREQASGIVQETLSFEDVDDPPGKADRLCDRGRGNRIGCRHHGAEQKSRLPVERSDEVVGETPRHPTP